MNAKELYKYAYSLLRYGEIDEEYDDRHYPPETAPLPGPYLTELPLKIVGMALASQWATNEIEEPLGVAYAGHNRDGPVFIGRYAARYLDKQEQREREQQRAASVDRYYKTVSRAQWEQVKHLLTEKDAQ